MKLGVQCFSKIMDGYVPSSSFISDVTLGKELIALEFHSACFSTPIIWFSVGPFNINSTKIITFELFSCPSHWPFIIIKWAFIYPTWVLGSSVRFGVIQSQKQASFGAGNPNKDWRSRRKKWQVQCNYQYLKPFQEHFLTKQKPRFARIETFYESIPTSGKWSCEREVKMSHFKKCQNISEGELVEFVFFFLKCVNFEITSFKNTVLKSSVWVHSKCPTCQLYRELWVANLEEIWGEN